MKKFLLLSMVAAFSATSIFAQKSALSSAKRALGSNDLAEARTLIEQAKTNPETATNPETWKIAGDIGDKAFENERIKLTLGKEANEKAMYAGLLEAYYPYVKADSLGELPDSKGRVKNKVRKDIASILKANQALYVNGGIFHYNNKEYKKAADFFEIYWNIPTLPMFQDKKNEFVFDSTYQTIKHYAVLTAIQGGDHERAIYFLNRAASEPFIENSTYVESDIYELLASEYMQIGDTVKYVETLYAGAEKYPKSKYFIPNLINHFIRKGENDKALEYLDTAIKNDPSNACDLNTVKGALLVDKKQYDGAVMEYKKALAENPQCESALEALAVCYILQAQELKDENVTLNDRQKQIENDKKTVELYKLSLPYIEKYTELLKARNADAHDIKGALIKLQNVYYNLSNFGVDKSKEMETIEAELEALK